MSEVRRSRVFVTDGSYPNALAAVRALGRAGYEVTVGEHSGVRPAATAAFWSRHCARRFAYPDPRRGADETVRALASHFSENRYDAAIPVGLTMSELFVTYRDELPVRTMLPSVESFRIAANKELTWAHASSIGIPVPRTVPAARWKELAVPVVFKHRRSGAVVASNEAEAAAYADRLNGSAGEYFAQAYIDGRNGFGYFGFFRDGQEAAYFLHERLVQFPAAGGPSVVARAIRDDAVRSLGKRLLESLHWHGPAMVEFKRSDIDGEYYLMEINPKLWGSLDLSIRAGCNFPLWIARALLDDEYPQGAGYRDGLTYQWMVPHGLQSALRDAEFRGWFMRNLFSRDVETDLCWSDPVATAAGILAMCARAVKPR